VPAPSLAEDATECAAKKPCLLQRANAKRAAVLVTVDVGQVLDEVVVHAEALSVDEDGVKIAAVDVEGAMTAVGAALSKKVSADLAPAIRKRLGLPAPVAAAAVAVAPVPTPASAPVASAPPPVEPSPAVVPAATVTASPTNEPGFWTTRRTVGAVVGGLGAASLLTGAVLLGLAAGANGEVQSLCPSGQQCSDPAAYDAYARAGSLQNTGLVVTGIGAAALAAGAVLLVLPSGDASTPSAVIVPTSGGAVLSVGGRF
jgi:hypothetical protein